MFRRMCALKGHAGGGCGRGRAASRDRRGPGRGVLCGRDGARLYAVLGCEESVTEFGEAAARSPETLAGLAAAPVDDVCALCKKHCLLDSPGCARGAALRQERLRGS